MPRAVGNEDRTPADLLALRTALATTTVKPVGGYSLVELVVVLAVAVTAAAISVPLLVNGRDERRAESAARYLAGRMQVARIEAIKRSANVALWVDTSSPGVPFALHLDGNRNGVGRDDIRSGVDPPIAPPERIDQQFPGVGFGVAPGVTQVDPGDGTPLADPIHLGRSAVLSFSPRGTSSGGSVYLLGRGRHQYAVRIFGATGRIRMLRYDFGSGRWISR